MQRATLVRKDSRELSEPKVPLVILGRKARRDHKAFRVQTARKELPVIRAHRVFRAQLVTPERKDFKVPSVRKELRAHREQLELKARKALNLQLR